MRAEINLSLSDFIRSENKQLAQIGPELDPVATEIEILLFTEGIITDTESLTGSVKKIMMITRT